LGEPKNLKGLETNSSHEIEKLKKNLIKKFPSQQVISIDERFTSKLASQTLISSGLKKKKRQVKGLLDEVSATIILQSFLQKRDNGF